MGEGQKPRIIIYALGEAASQYKALLEAVGCKVTVEPPLLDTYDWIREHDIFILGTPAGRSPDRADAGPSLCGLIKEMYGSKKIVVGVGPGEWHENLADEVIPDPVHLDPAQLARLRQKLEALL
ncbi:MAG: hypothetical protein V1735_01820 [Nanoarchaeota archaeon]